MNLMFTTLIGDIVKIILLLFLINIIFLLTVLKLIRRYYHFPIPAFMTRVIDNPIRRRFIQKPEEVAKNMQLEKGMVVVEIGPGKGNYTKAVAEKILPNGTLYAVDIQESVINNLKNRTKKGELPDKIVPMVSDAHNLSFLKDNSVDRIFAIACLPEIPNPVKVLTECKRILKPDGIISLCEIFSDPDYPTRKTEKRWAEEARLLLDNEFGNWFRYQLNFKKIDTKLRKKP